MLCPPVLSLTHDCARHTIDPKTVPRGANLSSAAHVTHTGAPETVWRILCQQITNLYSASLAATEERPSYSWITRWPALHILVSIDTGRRCIHKDLDKHEQTLDMVCVCMCVWCVRVMYIQRCRHAPEHVLCLRICVCCVCMTCTYTQAYAHTYTHTNAHVCGGLEHHGM